MPKNLKGKRYYYPTDQGFEEKIREQLKKALTKKKIVITTLCILHKLKTPPKVGF